MPSFWWTRYPITKERNPWTPRRVAAAERAVAREAEACATVPELRRFSTVAERIEQIDQTQADRFTRLRDFRARLWREARAALRSLDPNTRAAVLDRWNTRIYPGDPTYLFACIQRVAGPGVLTRRAATANGVCEPLPIAMH